MQFDFPQAIVRFVFAILVVYLVAVNAKPPLYPDNTPAFLSEQDAARDKLITTGIKPWEADLFAQIMAELKKISQDKNVNSEEFGKIIGALKNGHNMKRQNKFCKFNPDACFKK